MTEAPQRKNPWLGPVPLVSLIFLALLVGTSLLQYLSDDGEDPGTSHPLVGTTIPQHMLPSADADEAALLASGTPMVIDFWSTTCGPCLRMRPELALLHRRAGEGLAFRSVNTDAPHETRLNRVQAYAREHNIAWPVLLDDGRVSEDMGVRRIPAIFIVDSQGVVQRGYGGVTSARILERAVREVQEGQGS